VVGKDGEQLGIMPIREAQQKAYEDKLDLVEVAPSAKPPVCRIMDYGRFKFEQSKKDREAKKKQKQITVKEVKVRPNIDEHDYQVKVKNMLRFLADGDKVKVTITFRGREVTHSESGRIILRKMAEAAGENANIEREPKLEGRNMIMILAPKQS
jgi:translation initiation factor IF-3